MVRYKEIRPILDLMQCRVEVVDAHESLEARRAHIANFDKSKNEVVFNQLLDSKVVKSIEIVADGEYQGLLVTVATSNGKMYE